MPVSNTDPMNKLWDKVLQILKICSNFAADFGNRITAHGRQIKRKVVGYYPTQWTLIMFTNYTK